MAILPIVIGPDNPALRVKTKRVPKITKDIRQLAKDMIDTMYEANGVGLASPQVGRTERICIAVIGGKVIPLVNPVIKKKSKEMAMDQEGCLSLPNVWLDIPRSVEITLEYTDIKGKRQERQLKDFDARVVQHEVDHLEGVLITDYTE